MRIDTHIIAGNHDHYYTNTYVVNSLDEVVGRRYKNIERYNTPRTITIDGTDILLVPWINQANEEETRTAIKKTKAQIVMGHLELKGFEMFRGIKADHGDDVSVYDKFDLVFTGHYHHKSSYKNVHYIGAFNEHTWTDYNDPRGITILDTKTREFEFRQNPHSIFHMISYDDVKDTNIIETIQNTDYSKYKDVYVKIICANRTNPFAFDMMFDKLYDASPVDISIVEDAASFGEGDDDVIDQAQDTPTILKTYIEGLTLPVDNNKMISYVQDIYNEAIATEHIE